MPTVQIEGVGKVQFPDDMTPEQISSVIEREIMPGQQLRTTGQELGRQAGLAARYAVEGAGNVITIPANAASALISMLTGTQPVNYDQKLSEGLSLMGLPQPENATERVVGDASRAVAGTGGIIKAAKAAPGVVSEALQALPGRQAIGAAAGAAAAGTVREGGGGPLAQTAAGLAGGFVAPTAVDAAQSLTRGAARGTAALAATLTRSGQEKVAGRILNEQATDAGRAATNLNATAETVRGSAPTSGAASKDIGLIALEKGLRGQAPARFGERLSEQNQARQAILDSIAGTKADIVAGRAARDAATTPMREQALNAGGKAQTQVAIESIEQTLKSPVGKRDVPAAALNWVKGKLEGVDDPASLYAIRQDVGDAMAGKLGGDESKFKLARKELMQVQGVLDDVIESAAPGFKAYLARYRELSKPINQKEVLQEIQKRATLAAPDISTGREFLSQAKFRGAVNLASKNGGLDKLSADQLKTLNAVAADLDLGAAHTSSLVRAPGSDTFQNLSMANAIGAATGGKSQIPQWMQPIMRPFQWLLKGSDERLNQLLVDAMLDPKLAAQMMQRATPKNARVLSAAFRQRANAIARGSTLGASTEHQETLEVERQR